MIPPIILTLLAVGALGVSIWTTSVEVREYTPQNAPQSEAAEAEAEKTEEAVEAEASEPAEEAATEE